MHDCWFWLLFLGLFVCLFFFVCFWGGSFFVFVFVLFVCLLLFSKQIPNNLNTILRRIQYHDYIFDSFTSFYNIPFCWSCKALCAHPSRWCRNIEMTPIIIIIIPSDFMHWLVWRTWRPVFGVFASNVNYDVLIGWSTQGDWQPWLLYALWKREITGTRRQNEKIFYDSRQIIPEILRIMATRLDVILKWYLFFIGRCSKCAFDPLRLVSILNCFLSNRTTTTRTKSPLQPRLTSLTACSHLLR